MGVDRIINGWRIWRASHTIMEQFQNIGGRQQSSTAWALVGAINPSLKLLVPTLFAQFSSQAKNEHSNYLPSNFWASDRGPNPLIDVNSTPSLPRCALMVLAKIECKQGSL